MNQIRVNKIKFLFFKVLETFLLVCANKDIIDFKLDFFQIFFFVIFIFLDLSPKKNKFLVIGALGVGRVKGF